MSTLRKIKQVFLTSKSIFLKWENNSVISCKHIFSPIFFLKNSKAAARLDCQTLRDYAYSENFTKE